MRVPRLPSALAMALPLVAMAALAGCAEPATETQGEPWEPLECDPRDADWIGGGVRPLPFWNRTPDAMAAAYAEAAGHNLSSHRSGGPSVHEWALHGPNGTYLGQLELRSVELPGGSGSEWRIRSEAGVPAQEGSAWAQELVRRLAGDVEIRESRLDEQGILQVDLFQTLGAFRIVDTATMDAGLGAYRLHNNATGLVLRPWYDLSQARLEVDARDAIATAVEFWDCARGSPVHVVGWELAVLHGTLAYAVDLRDENPDSWLCIPPILVDAASGAVLGSASIDVCALPE